MRALMLVFIAWALVASTPARAEFVIAKCTVSGGCTCRLSDLSVDDLELITGERTPDGARDMTLVHVEGRDPYWTRADRTRINVLHGGAGQCDVQLFPPMTPEDGQWRIAAEPTDLSRCPMLRGKGLDTGGMQSATRNIQWGGSFHPSKLMDAGNAPVQWRKTGDNSWQGVMADEKQGSSGARVVHGFTLVSPRLIRGYSLFDFKLDMPAQEAAILSSMGMPMQCRSYTPFVARRQ